MKRVVLATPDHPAMRRYRNAAAAHAARQGEAPIASIVVERDVETSIAHRQTPFSWLPVADLVALYVDHGIDAAMADIATAARAIDVPVEYRTTRADEWARGIYQTFKSTPEPTP